MKKIFSLVMALLLSLFAIAQNVPSYVPTNGLVGWWPFNGNANDESGNGVNTVSHNLTFGYDRFGVVGAAAEFNGFSTYITTNLLPPVGHSARTFSFWAKPLGDTSGGFSVFSYGNQNAGQTFCSGLACYGTTNNFHASINDAGTYYANDQIRSNWNFYTVVVPSGAIRQSDVLLYMNGQLIVNGLTSYNDTLSINTGTATRLNIGRLFYDTTAWYKGSLGELGIWNRALTATEVQNLYHASLSIPCTASIINNDTTICFGQTISLRAQSPTAQSLTDIDGNLYPLVNAGGQVWLGSNLKVTHYQNGDSITNLPGSDWATTTSGAWCYFNNDASYDYSFGKLYNAYAVNDTRNVCPTSMRIPTDSEWIRLENYLGGSSIAGGKMKDTGYNYWLAPNTGATNESRLSIRGSEYRDLIGSFGPNSTAKVNGMYWTSTKDGDANNWARRVGYANTDCLKESHTIRHGFAVRCIMDTGASLSSSNISYRWSTGDTTANINVTPTQSTTYYVTVSNGISTCIDSVRVTVNNCACTANIINNDTTVCAGTRLTLTATSTSTGGSASNLPAGLRNGLVGYWPFNGNANNESGSGNNNGTVSGASLTTDRFGNANSAYSFNGSNNYIYCGNINAITPSIAPVISVSCWLNTSSSEGANSDPFDLRSTNNSSCQVYLNSVRPFSIVGNNWNQPISCGVNYLSATRSVLDQWLHVIYIANFTDNTIRLYINGVLSVDSLINSCNTLGSLTNPKFNIGSRFDYYNTRIGFFKGKLDDIAIWNRALTASEVSQLYSENTYRWSTGDTTATINVTPTQSTTYYVTVSNGITTCTDSVRVTVNNCNALTLQAGTQTACGPLNISSSSIIDVPVTVRNFRNMVSLQASLQWDSTVIHYQGIPSIAAATGITINDFNSPDARTLLLSWADANAAGRSLPDSAILFTIRYQMAPAAWGRSTALQFTATPNPLEAYRAPDSLVQVIPIAGLVKIGARPVLDTVRLNGCGLVRYNNITYTSSTSLNDTLRTATPCDSVYRRVILTVIPVPAISSVTSNSPVILGDTIRLTVSGQNLSGGTFGWNGPANFISSSQNPTLVAVPAAGGQYQLIYNSTCLTDTQRVTVVIHAGISGRIISPLSNLVSRVNLRVNNTSTLVNGSYQVSVPVTGTAVVKPSKNNDINKTNGVSVIDIILIQDHILRRRMLDAPYKIIAADANTSGFVSTGDLLFIRRLILGLDTTLPGSRLWSFVDSSYVFPDPTNPFPYRDSIVFSNAMLQSNRSNHTFIGMKLGDVNYDWNFAQLRPVPTQDVTLYHEDVFAPGNEVRIPVRVKNWKDLLGLQFTLQFNSQSMRFVRIDNNRLNVRYGGTRANEGLLAFIWNDDNNNSVSLNDNDILFELVFEKKMDFSVEKFDLVNSIAPIEAWDNNFARHNIVKAAGSVYGKTAAVSWKVNPNPTSGVATVTAFVTKQTDAELIVTAVDGKVLGRWKKRLEPGSNNWNLNFQASGTLSSGTYYIRLNGVDDQVQELIIAR